MTDGQGAPDAPFRLEEATIEQLHSAIRAGRTTCVAVVRQYIERARAYNGVASVLVTTFVGKLMLVTVSTPLVMLKTLEPLE